MKLYFFGNTVLEFLFEVVCYVIGKVTIPIVTFDRARSQGESEIISFPWCGIAILALIPSFNSHMGPRFCNSENAEQRYLTRMGGLLCQAFVLTHATIRGSSFPI